MEWAIGVGRDLHGPHILVEDFERKLSKLPLKGAVSRGVPTSGNRKLVVTLDLNAHQPVDSEEYVRAFGFGAGTPRSSHHVFRFLNHEGSQSINHIGELIIPSLVLIRALFRPSRYMLPALFWPQALDHVRFMENKDGVPRLQLIASWAAGPLTGYGDVLGPLTWITCFPSASAMANSVFALASEGILGIQPPQASARLSAFGMKIGQTLYVTRIYMLGVVATEAPVPGAEHCPTKFVFHAMAKRSGPKKMPRVPLPPRRADGFIEVTDNEWEVVEPILMGDTPARRFKLDQRMIFDSILRKLFGGVSWRATQYMAGGKEHAVHAWRGWSKSGRWDSTMAVLEKLRK